MKPHNDRIIADRPSVLWRLVALLVLAGPGDVTAAMLNGNFTAHAANTVELTTAGPVDWIHWGRFTEFAHDRKVGVAAAISDFSVIGSLQSSEGPFRRNDLSAPCNWQDGLQNSFATNITAAVYIIGISNGFRFTAPADTTLRVLRVYVAADDASGVLTATLSDNTTTGYTNVLASPTAGFYTIEYSADSANQTLAITWTGAANNSVVTLQSAALAFATNNNPPAVTLVSPALNANLSALTSHVLEAFAADSDGNVASVEFFADSIKIGEATNSPFTVLWTNPPTGLRVLTAKATDDFGATALSKPVEVFVHTLGGVLLGDGATPPATVDLSNDGTNDWVHWGLTSAASINRKAGLAPLIGDLKIVGPQPRLRYADNLARFNWNDGNPVASAVNTPTGVYVYGLTNGFELTLPASQRTCTVKVYVGLYAARANFQAWLSDASAPAFTDTTLNNHYNNTYRVYTLQFAAASEGQNLVIRHTAFNSHDTVFGNVTWQAVTLSGLPLPPRLLNPRAVSDAFTFSLMTEPGFSYEVEFTDSMPPTNWTSLTNFLGTGENWTVTDFFVPGTTSRFYRARRP